MNKLFALIFLFLFISMAQAEEILKSVSEEDQQAVIASTKQFIRTLDEGKYDESWGQLAPEMQKMLFKVTYIGGLKVLRSTLGESKSRKPIGINFIKDSNGAPPGNYAALFLNSEFQNMSGQEKVILKKSQGRWLIAGYFFEKSVKFNQ